MLIVDLRWNEIGPGGATAIVAMLQQNHCLIDIQLIGNGIPPSIQVQIDELLKKNRTCKLLEPKRVLLDDHKFIEYDTGLVSNIMHNLSNVINNYMIMMHLMNHENEVIFKIYSYTYNNYFT